MIQNYLITDVENLTEAKADDEYNKTYSSIDRDIFDNIIKADPTTRVVGNEIVSIGPNAKQLLLPAYMKGEIEFTDDLDSVTKALTDYIQKRGTYEPQYRNIAKFPSVKDFVSFVADPSQAVGIIDDSPKEVDPITDIYNKYYTRIPRDAFDKIIELDPETTESKLGSVAKNLLLTKYQAGESGFLRDPFKVKRAIKDFVELKATFPQEKQDIISYSTVEEFINYILRGPDSALTQDLKTNTTIDPKTRRAVKDDINFIASTRDYEVLEPKSHRAAYAISGGWNDPNALHWCTAWEPEPGNENDSYFNSYTSDGQRIINFINKKSNRGTENRIYNWQLQVLRDGSVGEFLDGRDRHTYDENKGRDFRKFLESHPDILNAIKDKDPFNKMPIVEEVALTIKYLDEPFVISKESDMLPLLKENTKTALASQVIEVVIENIKKIPGQLFYNFINITKVSIRGVSDIGSQAFKNCTALRDVSLDENLKVIGSEAFMNCVNLKKIRIPNSVENIKTRAFFDTSCRLGILVDKPIPLKIEANEAEKMWYIKHLDSKKS